MDNEKLRQALAELNKRRGDLNAMQSDATSVNTFPIPPNTDARKPIVQSPLLKTYFVRGLKELGPYVGSDIKSGGYPNESYSDVVFRLAHTPGKPAYNIRKNDPSALPLLAAAGEVITDPVNAIPFGSIAKGGMGYLASKAANIKKLATALSRMSYLAKPADMLRTVGEFVEEKNKYINRPEAVKTELTKEQADLINRITKNIGQQKFGQ